MKNISIIVPVYNVEEFLPRCLDSIVNQTLKNIEIICINDGSKDNCLNILKEYQAKDKRIKIIDKKNEGLSCARNDGMKIAEGEYISFVDSDDWIDLNFLEVLYNSAKKYDTDIALCGIKRVKKHKTKYMLEISEEKTCEELQDKIKTCNIPDCCYVWNKIYKSSFLKENNITFEPHVYFEDRCFSAQVIINSKKIVAVPNVFYYYYKNKNSIVQKKLKVSEKDSIYTYNKMINMFKEHNIKITDQTKKYKIFNITIFKIKYFQDYKNLIIFNFIKFKIKNKKQTN